MFNTLEINQFRCFQEQKIFLGKFLTVLAGRNSTGKSTILGMLGNAAELKKKDGSTYFSKLFRAEFSEIFKGSEQYDQTGSDKYKITISDESGNEIDYRQFRVTWQKKSTGSNEKRFRIIPYKPKAGAAGKKTDAKLDIPVYYLGLSRLFPIGEAETITEAKMKFASVEHKAWFIEQYTKILSLHDTINEVSGATIGNFEGKTAVGINTDRYDYLTNSSGQDNLGQILFALLSFRKLRETIGENYWRGGLLLIDEFDSTLHPSAQNSLIDLMLSEARKLKIQIVITTHSISLLGHIRTKYEHNNGSDALHEVELYYFTNQNRYLEIKRNFEFCSIESDLMVQSMAQNRKKIKIYSEDAEARWFLQKLITPYLGKIEMLDVCMGCKHLLGLFKADPTYFANVLLILDGDVTDNDINEVPEGIRKRTNNIVKLPGGVRPEQVLYNYLNGLPAEHSYWAEASTTFSFSWDSFKAHEPQSSDYLGYTKERDKYKQWFKDHKEVFDGSHLFEFWAEDNNTLVGEFLNTFVMAYNKVAERQLVPSISLPST
ncbi:MAG: AAA family ATPase [Clostridiaceae bacterium]